MRNRIAIATLGFALGALTNLSSCVVGDTGAGAGTAYSFGHLEGTLPGSPQKVVQASESVLKEQDIPIVSSGATGLDGKVVAKTALDKQIEITVKRHDETSSKISIRVGNFGDLELSRSLYEKIKAKL
jgi:hypothetical protein